MHTVLGSPIYMPPEIILHQPYDSKVDIWSSGVVVYMMLTGYPPFSGETKEEVYSNITKQHIDYDAMDFSALSSNAKDFLRLTLNKDANERISA